MCLIPAAIQGSCVQTRPCQQLGKKIAKKEEFHLYFMELEISKYWKVQNNVTAILGLNLTPGFQFWQIKSKKGDNC